jgi:ABC-type lipoprotein export system ATPase subunit
MVKDKDVVFMMGTTGSGKSTNILKCLGYKLKWGTYKNLQTLVPAGPL